MSKSMTKIADTVIHILGKICTFTESSANKTTEHCRCSFYFSYEIMLKNLTPTNPCHTPEMLQKINYQFSIIYQTIDIYALSLNWDLYNNQWL